MDGPLTFLPMSASTNTNLEGLIGFRQIAGGVMADDTVTLDDIIEKLVNENNSAKRLAGTVYYDRAHACINDTLDLWEMATEVELGDA